MSPDVTAVLQADSSAPDSSPSADIQCSPASNTLLGLYELPHNGHRGNHPLSVQGPILLSPETVYALKE